MNRLTFLLVVLISFMAVQSYAQEVCNNGIDDDGDGFIDCYDGSCSTDPACDGFYLGNDAACQVPPPTFPQFTMALDFSSPNETTNHLSRIAIGDLDRDGVPEIITMNKYTDRIFILNGNNGSIKVQKTVSWDPAWEIAIANLDNDNCAEIFFLSTDNRIRAYDCGLNLIWTSTAMLGDPINYGLADFDGDGKVELYCKDQIFDAHTGTRIIKTKATKSDNSIDDDNWRNINGGPVAVDIVGDSKLELVVGCVIYDVNLGTRTADSGTLTELKRVNDYHIRYEYAATSVADFNQDGFLDVIASGSANQHKDSTTVFFWDVQNNTVKKYSDPQPALGSDYTKGWKNGTGRLNIADLDGDGELNVSYVSGRFLYALDENFDLFWKVTINEETSGYTGCTLFDFNGDGKSEIVYRDEQFLYIIDGTNGTVYNQQACISRTNREYPIVADVDADGSTELCVTCGFDDQDAEDNFNDLSYSRYSHVRVFKSASEPWVPARRLWNQHGYFNVNVNNDLTIPRNQQKHHLIFSTGSCTQGPNRPLNGFLNQSPFLDSRGCPVYAAPDLNPIAASLVINPPTCPDLNFTVSFQFQNIGDLAISGNVPITFYDKNPTRPGAVRLNTITVSLNSFDKDEIFSVTNATVTGNGSDSLYIVLNDAGTTVPTPITLPNTTFVECNYDNIFKAQVIPLPVSITGLKIKDNIKCIGSTTPDNGAVRAFIPTSGGGENTADYNFYWSIGAVAKPIPADFQGSTINNLPEGTYTVFARHKTANCNSNTATVVVGRVDRNFPVDIVIENPYDHCQNPNGKLRAIVNDTDGDGNGDPTGNYTYVWYEGNGSLTDPVVSVSHIANGLKPLTYTVFVTENATGCMIPQSATVPDQTVKPVVAATKVDIICSNLTSGSVAANVGGVTAGFNFDWYDGATVKPTPDFTGSNYNNRPIGSYTVVATDNTSKCESDPVTVAVTQTTAPVVSVTKTGDMTSCEPTTPNGSASADVGGATAGYTFQWFDGQNTTLPALGNNPTISGLDAGIYTVKATDNATGCSDTEEVTIDFAVVTPSLILAAVGDMTNCTTPNGSVTVNVTVDTPADYDFFWYDGPVVKAATDYTDTDNVLSGLPVGTYTVKAIHKTKKCETGPITANVVDNTPAININLNAAVTVLPSDCTSPDGVMQVTVSAAGNTLGFNVEWYFGRQPFAGPPVRTDNGVTVSTAGGLRTGVYTVVATNLNNGCQASQVFDLPFANAHSLLYLSQTDVNKCNPDNIGDITVRLVPSLPATLFDEDDYEIQVHAGQNETATPIDVIPGVLGVTDYTTSNLTPGFYTLVAISNNPNTLGCKSVPLTVEILQNTTDPVIVPTSINANTNCSGATANGRITLNIDGVAPEADYSYNWFEGKDTSAPALGTGTTGTTAGSGEIAQNLPPGFYTVRVSKTAAAANEGCFSIGTFQIFDNPPTISLAAGDLVVTDVTLCSNPNGASAVVNGIRENGAPVGTGNYTFAWFDSNQNSLPLGGPPNTSNNISNLPAGIYYVTATKNAVGQPGLSCASAQIQFEIKDKTIGSVAVSLVDFTKPTRCLKPANVNGELQVSPSGNSALGYTVDWYAGSTVSGAPVFTGNTLSNITIPLGQPDITFTVNVRNNSNNCNVTDTYVLPLDVIPVTITASAEPLTFCSTDNGTVFATVTSGNFNDYTYYWSIGGVAKPIPADYTGKQVNSLPDGDYTVVAIDNMDNFCATAPLSVNVANQQVYPIVTASQVAPLTNCDPNRPNAVATATVGGDVVSYAFDWYLGNPVGAPIYTGVEINNIQATLYSVIATDLVTGCADTTQVTIGSNTLPIPPPEVVVISNVTRCPLNNDNGVLGASVNGNTKDYIFHWYTGNPGPSPDTATAVFRGEIFSNLRAGTYFVSATSRITGCISPPASGEVIEAPIYPDFEFKVESATCNESNGLVSLFLTTSNVNIATIDWTFNGTPVASGPVLADAVAGVYSVTVTSDLDCATTKEVEILTEIHPFNGVSRNGDGRNDIFHINCIENFPNNHVQIFNRAGTLVYEADGYDNIDIFFDGKSNKGISLMGNNLPDGTYYFIIDKRNGTKKIAGYLEIVN